MRVPHFAKFHMCLPFRIVSLICGVADASRLQRNIGHETEKEESSRIQCIRSSDDTSPEPKSKHQDPTTLYGGP